MKDGLVYVSTTESVSKYDKTAAREDSGCQGVREMTYEGARFQDSRHGVRFALSYGRR